MKKFLKWSSIVGIWTVYYTVVYGSAVLVSNLIEKIEDHFE